MSRILEIRMQSNAVSCSICGVNCEHRWSVPTYNGDVVSNDFPDELIREGGGNQPVCEHCYDKHERGRITTWDYLYIGKPPMGVHLMDGAGI